MRRWRGAHAWCVRVERALHACARVQGAARRAWAWRCQDGQAMPVRDMPLGGAGLQLFYAPCRTRSEHTRKGFLFTWLTGFETNVTRSLRKFRRKACGAVTRATRLRRVLPAPRRRTRAPSFQCQVIHTSTGAALFMTTSHVAVLNKQVNTFSRLLNNRKSCRRVQSCRHIWYVTTGASQPVL